MRVIFIGGPAHLEIREYSFETKQLVVDMAPDNSVWNQPGMEILATRRFVYETYHISDAWRSLLKIERVALASDANDEQREDLYDRLQAALSESIRQHEKAFLRPEKYDAS